MPPKMDTMNTLASESDTGRLEACLANSACFREARKAGDGCSCSTALGLMTGKELETFLGAILHVESNVVSVHGGFPSESGKRD